MVADNRNSAELTTGAPAERVLVIERVFDAPPPLVFSVWKDPQHLTRWWGPKDFTLPFCETDFRVGGSYRFCMRSPEGVDHWVWGMYREIVEPERIVFTWGRHNEQGGERAASLVTVTFEPFEGQTKFKLHHAGFETIEDRDDHNGGWSECLERLARYVAAQA